MIKTAFLIGLPLAAAGISDPAPPGFELWLRNLLYIAGIVFFALQVVGKFRRRPSIDVEIKDLATREHVAKIEMTLPTMASKSELHGMAKEMSANLQHAVEHLDVERRTSIGTLHRDLNAAQLQIAAVVTEAETHTRQLAQQDAKIDRILERLPCRRA